MYCGKGLWFLLQARGVLCEVRTEGHAELLVFRALM